MKAAVVCGRSLALGVVLLLGVGVAALLVYDQYHVGRVLDSYRGVPVYDNGILFFRSYGKHYAQDGYYYGQKWQCVEFVKRFFHDAEHHQMPQVMGHARSFFDETVSDGGLNAGRALVQYRNGSKERPRPDDLLVFTDTKYGHVAIVTEVSENGLEIIQQNILGHTRQRLTFTVTNGHYFVMKPRTPAGWLRTTNGS